MEREDTAARLTHEKEELLEELKGARSGQNRSAEEVSNVLLSWLAEPEGLREALLLRGGHVGLSVAVAGDS